MSPRLNFRTVLHFIATITLSVVSYAAMAQSPPSADSCSHAMSSLQKRLYAHFLAGPAALRNYIFTLRGIHLLDIHDVDAWARDVAAHGCATGQMTADSPRDGATRPALAAMPQPALAASSIDERSDGCSTNAAGVMRCSGPSERTREGVVAEARNARAAGELARVGELADAIPSIGALPTSAFATTREQVRQELVLARAAHALPFGER